MILVHHENRAGTVSGAWEGSGDTLLHVEARGNGYTSVHIQKARWSSVHHNTTLDLAWTDGEGFRLKEPRTLLQEVEQLLTDGTWRTAKEIAAPSDAKTNPGIGANVDSVKDVLEQNPERFETRTGEAAQALGRSPRAVLWGLTRAAESVESVGDSLGTTRATDSTVPALKGRSCPGESPIGGSGRLRPPSQSVPMTTSRSTPSRSASATSMRPCDRMSWDDSDFEYSNGATGSCQSCGEATAEPWHALCADCYREEQGWSRPDADALRHQAEDRERVSTLRIIERLNELELRVARLEGASDWAGTVTAA